MTEPLYYRLVEVEDLLRISRDSLTRFMRAGLLVAQGQGRGKRITGASVRALARRYHVEPDTVGQWIDKGWLPASAVARYGNHYVDERALEGWQPPCARRLPVGSLATKLRNAA